MKLAPSGAIFFCAISIMSFQNRPASQDAFGLLLLGAVHRTNPNLGVRLSYFKGGYKTKARTLIEIGNDENIFLGIFLNNKATFQYLRQKQQFIVIDITMGVDDVMIRLAGQINTMVQKPKLCSHIKWQLANANGVSLP